MRTVLTADNAEVETLHLKKSIKAEKKMQMMFQQFKTKLAEQKADTPKETAEFKKLSPSKRWQ